MTPQTDIIRRELNKLKKMPPWGRAQSNHWDQLSNFVYQTLLLSQLWHHITHIAQAEQIDPELFGAYTIRRWYNHHTHDQILQTFLAHPDVEAEPDTKHHTIDFYLRGIPFDLKISRFPRAYPETLKYAWQNRHHLALWQYQHQSKQGRYHTGNRLFIMLHHRAQPERSWQLRRDFDALERLINNFLAAPTLLGLALSHQHTDKIYRPWAAVLFHVK
ncbi:MAG: hypothetical protein KDJ52_00485 [Anaerolineae bacterium]|nr:hypothetical protein [Anaerolineae bacterium]